jgi:hypothetical protein
MHKAVQQCFWLKTKQTEAAKQAGEKKWEQCWLQPF